MKNLTLTACFAIVLLVSACGSDSNRASAQESNAPLTLVEYSDYQCPTCAYFHPIIEQLKEEYGDDLEVEYRYFPLNSHQYAEIAARAVEAARQQGEFDAMQDVLFENQQSWSSGGAEAKIMGYAEEIGLDMDQFEEDLNSEETAQTVRDQKQEGLDRGVNGTPTFYVNGEELSQMPETFEQFKRLLDIYLEKAKSEAA